MLGVGQHRFEYYDCINEKQAVNTFTRNTY